MINPGCGDGDRGCHDGDGYGDGLFEHGFGDGEQAGDGDGNGYGRGNWPGRPRCSITGRVGDGLPYRPADLIALLGGLTE